MPAQQSADVVTDSSSLSDLLAKLQTSAQSIQPADAAEPAQQPGELPDFFRQLMVNSASKPNVTPGGAMPPIPASASTPSNPLDALLRGPAPPSASMPPPSTPPQQPAYPASSHLTPPRNYSPPAHVAKSPLGPARPPRHGRKDSDAEIVEKVGRVMERERKQKALLDSMMGNIVGVDSAPPPPQPTEQHTAFPPQQSMYRPVPMPPPPCAQQIVLPNGTLLATPPRHYLPQMGRPSYPPFHAPSPTYPSGHVPMLLAQQASLASPAMSHGQIYSRGRPPPIAMQYPPLHAPPMRPGSSHTAQGPSYSFPPPSGLASAPRPARSFGAPNTASSLSHSANDLLSLLKG